MVHLLSIAIVGLVISGAYSAPAGAARRFSKNCTIAQTGLNDYAKSSGLEYFGTAVDIPGLETSDNAYMAVANDTHEFGQLTATNYMKYLYTEPQQGVFDFTSGDQVVNLAKANGQLVRCHNLIWHLQLPSWLEKGTFDKATLISIMENHITALVKHWGSSCYAWDVVNEAIDTDGSYRSTIWYDIIGPDFIPLAFAAAVKAAPPEVKLYYNDYSIESQGAKSSAVQALVSLIQSKGIRIDGVGLQCHFAIGQTPTKAEQMANLAAFTKLGIEVALTEVDISATSLPPSASDELQQKSDFMNTVAACKATVGCIGVTLWDFVDKYSWVQAAATPWTVDQNGELVKKQAYQGIVDGLTQ